MRRAKWLGCSGAISLASGSAAPSTSTAGEDTASFEREIRMLVPRPQAGFSCQKSTRLNDSSARQLAKALGETGDGARVEAAAPRLGKAERSGHLVETFAFQVMTPHQRAFVFGQIIERGDE